jgi:hypothetical protein
MPTRTTALYLIACVLIALSLTAKGDAPAVPVDMLKAGANTFSLNIDYRGPATGKKDPSLILSLSPLPPTMLPPNIERMVAMITEDQAKKIIDVVVAENILGEPVPPGQLGARRIATGYVMMVHVKDHNFEKALGADLCTLRYIDALRAALDGNAAKTVDKLLDFLKDSRRQWTDEGRVFDRDGLALFIKPPANAFPPGKPVTFDLRFQNTSDHPLVLTHDLAEIDRWKVIVRSEKDQSAFMVARQISQPGAPVPPATLKPGETVAMTLSLAGCQYFAQRKEDQAKAVPIDSLPPGKYTATLARSFESPLQQVPQGVWTGSVATAPIAFEAAGTAPGPSPSGGAK